MCIFLCERDGCVHACIPACVRVCMHTCTFVCTRVHTCVHVHICVLAYGPEDDLECCFFGTESPCILRQGLSLAWNSQSRLGCLASELKDLLSLCPRHWHHSLPGSCLAFNKGSGEWTWVLVLQSNASSTKPQCRLWFLLSVMIPWLPLVLITFTILRIKSHAFFKIISESGFTNCFSHNYWIQCLGTEIHRGKTLFSFIDADLTRLECCRSGFPTTWLLFFSLSLSIPHTLKGSHCVQTNVGNRDLWLTSLKEKYHINYLKCFCMRKLSLSLIYLFIQ